MKMTRSVGYQIALVGVITSLVLGCFGKSDRGVTPDARQRTVLKNLHTWMLMAIVESDTDHSDNPHFGKFLVAQIEAVAQKYHWNEELKGLHVNTNWPAWEAALPSSTNKLLRSAVLMFVKVDHAFVNCVTAEGSVTNRALNSDLRLADLVVVW